MAFQLIDTSESPVVVSGVTIPDFDETTNGPTSTGIGTTLQTDDIVIIVHTAERRGGGSRNVEPAGANGAHPTGYSIATSSGGTSLGWSWTSIGNATSGNSNGNAEVGVGAYYYQVQASDTKTNVIATLTHPTGTGLSPKNFSRVLVLRGVDFVSAAALASNARSSRNPTSPTDNGTSGSDITWNQPSTTTGFWDSGDFPNEVLGLYIGSYRNATNIDPTEATAGGVTRITSTAVSSWHTGEASSSTTESTTPAGFSTNLRGHVQIQLLMKYADFSAADFTTRGQSRDGNGNTADQASLFIPFNIIAGGTDHPVTSTDTSTTTDVVSRIQARSFSETDASTSSDSIERIHGQAKTFAETDASTSSDSLSRTKSKSQLNTDSNTSSDILEVSKASVLSVTDASTASGSVTRVESGNDRTHTKTDASTSADILETTRSQAESSSDSTTTSDILNASKSGSELTTDSSSASDSIDRVKASGREASETDASTATDVLTIVTVQNHQYAKTDVVVAADSLLASESGANFHTKTDSTSSSDILQLVKENNESSTDLTTTADILALVKSNVQDFTDSSTSTDILEKVTLDVKSFLDSSSASDLLSTLQSGSQEILDSATVIELLSFARSATSASQDSSTSSDILALVHSNIFTAVDSSSGSDSVLRVKTGDTPYTKTDLVSTGDILSASKTGNHVFSVTDVIEAADDLTKVETKARIATETDSASAGDSITREQQNEAEFTKTDSSSAGDLLTATTGLAPKQITDAVDIIELLEISKNTASETTDSTGASDFFTLLRSYSKSFVDSSTGSGSLSAAGLPDRVDLLSSTGASDDLAIVYVKAQGIQVTIPGIGNVTSELLTEVQALAVKDVWNTALSTLGITTVSSITESSPQQSLLSSVFPLFRQQFIADHMWNGAKKTRKLTALTTNSTDNAVLDRWEYAYELPTSANILRVWRLNGKENRPDHIGGNPAICTNRWEIEIVTISTTNYRALCTNESEALIEYVFDVGNEGITLLGPATQHAMGMALAVYVATNFGKSASEIAQLDAMAKEAITAAKGIDGQEGTPQIFGDTSLLSVRSIGN